MFMRLVPKLAEVMAALESSYKPFVNKVGSIIESAKLWYDAISGALIAEGFVQNAENRCICLSICGRPHAGMHQAESDRRGACEDR